MSRVIYHTTIDSFIEGLRKEYGIVHKVKGQVGYGFIEYAALSQLVDGNIKVVCVDLNKPLTFVDFRGLIR